MPEMNNLKQLTYQHFMITEFQGRKSRNPSYSLRAFARDLGLAAPKLSEILRHKGGLSETSALRLKDKLGLTGKEAEIFVNLVVSKHGRRTADRLRAEENLKQLRATSEFNELAIESFKVISDWYHFAILELTEVIDFKSDIAWIAQRLNIQQEFVEDAVKRLFDFGLLAKRENGDWHQTEAILATPSGIPSTAIRNHHRQVLSKANEAILNFPVAERDFSSTTMAVASEQIEDVQTLIKEFRRSLAKKLSESPEKDRVYCLSIQFFPFDHKEESP